MIKELQSTEHDYFCRDDIYTGLSSSYEEFETWIDFKQDWLQGSLAMDDDYNYLFRFDIINKYDKKLDIEIQNEFSLKLYFMMQRKGLFVPICIKTITEKDLEEINELLKHKWEYLKMQWKEYN